MGDVYPYITHVKYNSFFSINFDYKYFNIAYIYANIYIGLMLDDCRVSTF